MDLSHHLKQGREKYLTFRGYRDIGETRFMIKVSLDEKQCWIEAEKPNFKQTLRMPKQQYLDLLE